jgi:hypothetical protein
MVRSFLVADYVGSVRLERKIERAAIRVNMAEFVAVEGD